MNAALREGKLSITLPSFRRLAFDFRLEPRAMLAIGIALAGVILFFEIQIHLRAFLWNRPERIPPVLIAAIVGAVAFVRADYRHFPIVFTVLARATASGLVAELIFEPPNSVLADPAFADLAEFINWGYWVALVVAGLSILRPSFLFPAGLYLVAARIAADYVAGYGSDDLDIRYMSEMAQFLGLAACGISVLRFFSVRDSAPKHLKALSSDDLRLLTLSIAFIR